MYIYQSKVFCPKKSYPDKIFRTKYNKSYKKILKYNFLSYEELGSMKLFMSTKILSGQRCVTKLLVSQNGITASKSFFLVHYSLIFEIASSIVRILHLFQMSPNDRDYTKKLSKISSNLLFEHSRHELFLL